MLPKRSWVKISQTRTLSVGQLSNRLGSVAAEELEEIIAGLNQIIGE